jgi:hypothetical protein
MGFNKRFLNKEQILRNQHHIMEYLDADAVFLMDEFSREVYKLFNSGSDEKTIINYINNNK